MKRRTLAGAVAVVFATVTVSLIEGTPHRLPGVALGSPVLLHAERGLALARGDCGGAQHPRAGRARTSPIELSTSGLRYEAGAADDAAGAAADLQEQLDDLGRLVVELAERLDALAQQPEPVSTVSTHPTTAAQPPVSAAELARAMQARNAVRRTEVERRVASLRRIAERLRAVGR